MIEPTTASTWSLGWSLVGALAGAWVGVGMCCCVSEIRQPLRVIVRIGTMAIMMLAGIWIVGS